MARDVCADGSDCLEVEEFAWVSPQVVWRFGTPLPQNLWGIPGQCLCPKWAKRPKFNPRFSGLAIAVPSLELASVDISAHRRRQRQSKLSGDDLSLLRILATRSAAFSCSREDR